MTSSKSHSQLHVVASCCYFTVSTSIVSWFVSQANSFALFINEEPLAERVDGSVMETQITICNDSVGRQPRSSH